MTESEVLAASKGPLEEEAALQGWAPGYILRQCQLPKQLENGEKEYFFVVEGEPMSGSQVGDEDQEAQNADLKRRDVAASP